MYGRRVGTILEHAVAGRALPVADQREIPGLCAGRRSRSIPGLQARGVIVGERLRCRQDQIRLGQFPPVGIVTGAILAAPELPGGIGVLWHGITVREQVMADVTAQVLTAKPLA